MSGYKTYLNREEKNELLMMLGYTGFLEELIEKWAELNRPKELLKYLRMTMAFNQKVTDLIIKHLQSGQVEGLARLAKQQKNLINKDVDLKVEYEKTFEMNWEDFADLAEIVLCNCMICTLKGNEQEQCNIKDILLRYDLDPLNTEPQKGQCPYQYKTIV